MQSIFILLKRMCMINLLKVNGIDTSGSFSKIKYEQIHYSDKQNLEKID